jgi:hypothetical protein
VTVKLIFSGEKMDVIRHNDIASDRPFRSIHPCIDDQIMDFIVGQDAVTAKGACGDVQNNAQITR